MRDRREPWWLVSGHVFRRAANVGERVAASAGASESEPMAKSKSRYKAEIGKGRRELCWPASEHESCQELGHVRSRTG